MSILKKSALLLTIPIFLSGCSLFGNTPEEEIHTVLESTVKLENNQLKQSEPLSEVESKEQVIYDKISATDASEQIHELAVDAIKLAELRKEKLEQEKEYILSGKKEFAKIEPLIKKIKKKDVKDKVVNIKTIMDERYSIYEEIYETYMKGIENDIILYKLFQSDALTLESFKEQAKINNETYKKLDELNNSFNKKTQQFNESKKTFYDAAGIKVKEQ